MIVHFGLHLDALQPLRPRTVAGELTAGPTRLLEMLEIELGLPPVRARPGEALLAYRRCLAECDDLARFYHGSFEVDALGVARTLSGWREQWYEAGWRGDFAAPVSLRLADIAAVERLARERVPLARGQRIARISEALASGLGTQLERIVLHDRLGDLPAAWRELLAHFPIDEAPGLELAPHGRPGSDLARVQHALLALLDPDTGRPRERVPLVGDSSFMLVRGVSRDLTAQAIGEYLLQTGASAETLVLAERDGIIVDNALERVGLPRAGFRHYSRFRAVTQVLKLCLGLVWKPMSADLLLQFLIHPTGPLPDRVRSELAAAVAREPGVGGRAWQAVLSAIAARLDEQSETSESAMRELRSEIAYWLECERFRPELGAPLAVLIERTERCARWLARRMHTRVTPGEQDLYGAAEAQCAALVAALEALGADGAERLGRLTLERLVDEVSGHAPDPSAFAEAGHVRAASSPATVTSAWPTVVWWDLEPEGASLRHPWSASEHEELRANGVDLPSMSARIRARTAEWLRPIANAERTLIFVVHERERGDHPLVSALASAVEHAPGIALEASLLEATVAAKIPGLEIATRPLSLCPLPRPRRWWQLPATASLATRDTESYSSLAKLIDYPHEWVLRYAARLHPGRAGDLAREQLLYGNLAHRLLESFFTAERGWASLDDAALGAWLAATVGPLIEREGAVLDEPGARVARERVVATLESALRSLVAHLRSAAITTVEAERWIDAPFGKQRIRGGIDLLAKRRDGRAVVLDVKWSGQDRRGTELEQGRALQLATYAYMCEASGTTSEWPAHAYFIVTSGNILASDPSFFPDALIYAPERGESLPELWARITETVEWRWKQLRSGSIEVNAPGASEAEHRPPPASSIALANEPDRFDEFSLLTGFEEGV